MTLFEKKEDCCGCGACRDICPVEAIGLKLDEQGFYYPVVDKSRCIGCGKCRKVCVFTAPMGEKV